jgi:hypothetical protein
MSECTRTGAHLRRRWAVIAADDAVWVEVRRITGAAPGSRDIVVYDGRLGSRRRSRRRVGDAGLVRQRELLVLPSLRRPLYLVEDDATALRWFAGHVLTVPPTPGLHGIASAAVAILARSWPVWRLVWPSQITLARPPAPAAP